MPKQIDFNDIQSSEDEPKQIDWNTIKQGAQDDLSMMGMLLESGARNVFDSTMNIPNALGKTAGNALAYPTAAIQSGIQALAERAARANFDGTPGQPTAPLTPWGGFSDNLAAAQNVPVVRDLVRGYDAPTSTDAQAFADAAALAAWQGRAPDDYAPLGEAMERRPQELTNVGEFFRQKRDEYLEGYIQRREAEPFGAGTGDVVGDVASLAIARKPFVSASRQARMARGETASAAPVVASQKMAPDWKRFLQRQAEKYQSWFKESGYKIAETGVEGAYLAAIQDEDPVMAAAAGAGLQAATNLTERVWADVPDFGMKPGITRAGVKAGITAFGITSLIQMFKELTPAGRDRILESDEAGYKKAAFTMMAAVTLHASGFGRPSKQQLDELGMLADTWHSARRGSVLSLISEIESDDSGDIDRVWMAMQNPGFFDATAQRRLIRAFENDDISHKDTIETLMESDRHFRRKVISLRENPQFLNQPFQQTESVLRQGAGAVEDGLDNIDQRVRGLFNE